MRRREHESHQLSLILWCGLRREEAAIDEAPEVLCTAVGTELCMLAQCQGHCHSLTAAWEMDSPASFCLTMAPADFPSATRQCSHARCARKAEPCPSLSVLSRQGLSKGLVQECGPEITHFISKIKQEKHSILLISLEIWKIQEWKCIWILVSWLANILLHWLGVGMVFYWVNLILTEVDELRDVIPCMLYYLLLIRTASKCIPLLLGRVLTERVKFLLLYCFYTKGLIQLEHT